MSAHENKVRILVVDDKREFAETIADGLCDAGYEAQALGSGRAALVRLQEGECDALITDLRMPDMDGLELVAASRALSRDRPVIVMTAYAAVDSAVESIRRGAYHYLTKPFKREELLIFLERALDEVRLRKEAAALKTTLNERGLKAGIVGRSKAVRDAMEVVDRVSKADVPVLITGETGTGKGLWARAIHLESRRANHPFVTVNCAALPETLLESELFGHVKGAFTSASENAPGLFAEADRGTLFLDEIGEMTPGLQAKLLHVLEEGVVRPVGSTKERRVDVRLITATHRELRELVRSQRFREDLLYRLDVVSLELPALRHRREDLPELIELFLRQSKTRYPDSPVERIGPDALSRMMDHLWPGNVRELSHVVERLVVLGRQAAAGVQDLPPSLGGAPPSAPLFHGEIIPVRELQRRYAGWVLEQMGGHKGHTADKLGVDAKTLSKWLNRDADTGQAPSAEAFHA